MHRHDTVYSLDVRKVSVQVDLKLSQRGSVRTPTHCRLSPLYDLHHRLGRVPGVRPDRVRAAADPVIKLKQSLENFRT